MLARKYEEYTTESPFMYTYERDFKLRKEIRRQNRLYFLKQKLSGLVMFGISVAAPVIFDGDITMSIILFPLGLFLMFTKEKVMEFEGK